MTPQPHPGHHWRAMMAGRQVTQVAVAEQMNLSTKHLNQIVQGKVLPSVHHVVEFAQLMGVKPDMLWQVQCAYMLEQALRQQKRPKRAMKPTPVRRGRRPAASG